MSAIKLKPEMATKGFFLLDHTPTGKVFTGTSANMLNAIRQIEADLRSGTCECRPLQALYQKEPEFTAKVFPQSNMRDAQRAEKTFRVMKSPHLLLN